MVIQYDAGASDVSLGSDPPEPDVLFSTGDKPEVVDRTESQSLDVEL